MGAALTINANIDAIRAAATMLGIMKLFEVRTLL
jgi:hypothetical protein